MTDSVNVLQPGFRLVDTTGTPISGGSLEFYEAESTEQREVFSDSELLSSLGSVVYTDSSGYPVTAQGGSTRTLIYTGTGLFKVVIKDGDGVAIATHDNVTGAVVAGGGGEEASGITQAQADVRYVRNPNALTAETDLADADIVPVWDNSAAGNRGVTWANLKANLAAEGVVFPSGTIMPFYQASAPTGWTKDETTALNNAAIRLVTGAGGATGGSAAFTTVFASRTITQANLPSVNFTGTSGAAGSHNHDFNLRSFSSGGSHSGLNVPPMSDSGSSDGGDGTTFTEPNHTHSLSVSSGGSGTAMDFAVKYADFIVCERD